MEEKDKTIIAAFGSIPTFLAGAAIGDRIAINAGLQHGTEDSPIPFLGPYETSVISGGILAPFVFYGFLKCGKEILKRSSPFCPTKNRNEPTP